MNTAGCPAFKVIFVDANITLTLTFEAIMAAEERRKQKEQIKILKQQVGVLYMLLTNLFPPFLFI